MNRSTDFCSFLSVLLIRFIEFLFYGFMVLVYLAENIRLLASSGLLHCSC